MKAIVFDNSGTLIERYRALKDIEKGIICDDISSLDIVDNNTERALVVLQTDPAKCIINAKSHQTIYEFIKRNNINIDISYSSTEIKKEELLNSIKDDKSKVSDIQDTIKAVVAKKYNVQICSGSGFIVAIDKSKIEFTITSGGKVFPEVPSVVAELQKRDIDLFIASGDRKASLKKLAKYTGIPVENVFDTANSWNKKEIIKGLKKNYKVMMVGNGVNDVFALKEADIGVLTVQQEENTPQKVFDAADVVVDNIKEILDIEF
ncbi:MAG: HAD family hydrolase [Methanobacterium sp.]|uniref:HAD family hydrolase n=1 Tax=Methanobacterium sp. TaxID=2164 RepID=UPI003D65B97E|nr:HAD family hydrolase [Methanobacterium sp.]